jgi:hypothetical protein
MEHGHAAHNGFFPIIHPELTGGVADQPAAQIAAEKGRGIHFEHVAAR